MTADEPVEGRHWLSSGVTLSVGIGVVLVFLVLLAVFGS